MKLAYSGVLLLTGESSCDACWVPWEDCESIEGLPAHRTTAHRRDAANSPSRATCGVGLVS